MVGKIGEFEGCKLRGMEEEESQARQETPEEQGVCEVQEAQEVQEKRDPELDKERSEWVHQVLVDNPGILELRERALGMTRGHSFANVVHTETVSSGVAANRHAILELVYQHLNAIGMYQTAQILATESGHEFQESDQSWEKTDLHLLTSMGVGHQENAWEVVDDPGHHSLPDFIEEDFFAAGHREDPNTIWEELTAEELSALNVSDQQSDPLQKLEDVKRCSLRRLILIIVLSNKNQMKEQEYVPFFIALHFITSSEHFFRHLVTLYEADYGELNEEGKKGIKFAVLKIIKSWVNYHGKFIGLHTIDLIQCFLTRIKEEGNMSSFDKIIDSILTKTLPNLGYGKYDATGNTFDNVPEPKIPDGNVLFSRDLTLFDPEPEEVARQICLVLHQVFKDIHSLEIIKGMVGQQDQLSTPTLNEYDQFCERLGHLFLEEFVNGMERPRMKSSGKAKLFDRMLLIAENLLKLNNFEGVKQIVKIVRKEGVMDLIQPKQGVRQRVEDLWRECGGSDEEGKENGESMYESGIGRIYEYKNMTAAIPNMKAEFVRIWRELGETGEEGGREGAIVDGEIDWEYVAKFARRTAIIYEFQNAPYNFHAISQIRKLILREPVRPMGELEAFVADTSKHQRKRHMTSL